MDGVKLGFTWFLGVYGSRLDLKSVWDAIPTFSMPFNPTYGLTQGHLVSISRESGFNGTRSVPTTFCIHFRYFAL